MSRRSPAPPPTAEEMARRQREISVSEFFLKNRHLLGFDSPRRALLTAVKEAVDNALDACEEAGILPEIAVEIVQIAPDRFEVTVTDNGPGIVRAQIPKIFARLLYGSKFHRLRMSRGQQGIGISAAAMYGQLTTGRPALIRSRTARAKTAHEIEVAMDTRANRPVILKDVETEWRPTFPAERSAEGDAAPTTPVAADHGTAVTLLLEGAYVRGRLSVDEYLRQCALVNPHLRLHARIALLPKRGDAETASAGEDAEAAAPAAEAAGAVGSVATSTAGAVRGEPAAAGEWRRWPRAVEELPPAPVEIRPHPHGVELGVLIQMLKHTSARTLRAALTQDFSRVSDRVALDICARAGLDPKSNPARIAHRESEALFKALQSARLMRPPTDCLSPIGEERLLAGLRKEVAADFYTAVTRDPEVYRGHPFQIEAALAYARPGAEAEVGADEPVRLLRFANRAPLLYAAGACAITRAVAGVNWKAYGLAQPKGALPLGPVVIVAHMASVWVPFTSESKDAIAHYPEILREITFALQECGRRLAVFLSRRRREAEAERKRSHIEKYIPHLARGLRAILDLDEREEEQLRRKLTAMLERSRGAGPA